jgi:hypothetical protein
LSSQTQVYFPFSSGARCAFVGQEMQLSEEFLHFSQGAEQGVHDPSFLVGSSKNPSGQTQSGELILVTPLTVAQQSFLSLSKSHLAS